MITNINRKIKIAQVITRMDWGGPPDIVRIICESLDKNNYKVKLITGPNQYPSKKTKEFLEKFKDNIIIVPFLKRNINPLWDFLALIKLYFIFKKEKFDIVHIHTAKAGVLGRFAAYVAGISFIVYMPHGHDFYGYFGPLMSKSIIFLEKFSARFTNKIIALTELEKNDYLSLKIKSLEDIKVIPSGLMPDDFYQIEEESKRQKRKELGLELHEKIVGMVSRLEPVKGPEYFIKAAAEVIKRFKNVKFLVAGEGSLRPYLEKKAVELGLKDKIKFLGWREDALEIISILDILVQPSLNEGVGRVLLEAQRYGIPVVASRVGGIPEIVKENETGFLVNSKDYISLSQKLFQLIEDSDLRNKMGRAAIDWSKDKFTAKAMVLATSKLYLNLVNKKQKNSFNLD